MGWDAMCTSLFVSTHGETDQDRQRKTERRRQRDQYIGYKELTREVMGVDILPSTVSKLETQEN